jgi:opacity protein-like surface antigen
MKRLCASAFLLLGTVCLAQAQSSMPTPLIDSGNAAPDFSATSAAKSTLLDSLAAADSFSQPLIKPASQFASPTLTTALPAEAAPADPATPSPKPKFIYGGRDDYRWQLSLSAVWIHFQSSVFNAEAVGLKTTVTYFLNEWLGVEGSFTGAFAPPPTGFKNEDAKIALYGGGPKIAWRQRQWEPWVHAIFGGAHENPQTADASRSSYSIMAGGGADYRWNPHVSFRLEADYVRTGFFHESQNNLLLAGGIVLHF